MSAVAHSWLRPTVPKAAGAFTVTATHTEGLFPAPRHRASNAYPFKGAKFRNNLLLVVTRGKIMPPSLKMDLLSTQL